MGHKMGAEHDAKISAFANFVTYFCHQMNTISMVLTGVIDMWWFKRVHEPGREGYKGLYTFDYSLYMLYFIRKCTKHFEVPVCSVPGVTVEVIERVSDDCGWTVRNTGKTIKLINTSSYNYLGLSQNDGACTKTALRVLKDVGYAVGSSRGEYGTLDIHRELEQLTAEFLSKEDSVSFGMGFATNLFNIRSLVKNGTLIVSDSKNHNSIINGIKSSRATWRKFRNNDMEELETVLQEAIIDGQPNCGEYTPWTNILIVVEGIYSMEGSILRLPELIALKKKYKAFLYIDEAHSIGALGSHGKGVVDYWGCDFADVDLLMGTYTKSFGSAGGYIAGSKNVIAHIRNKSLANLKAHAMSPPVAAQIVEAFKILMGRDGTDTGATLINNLSRNSRYLRNKLKQQGLIVLGDEGSPVVPVVVKLVNTVSASCVYLMERNVGVSAAGYPTVPITSSILRLCISAGHSKEQLDKVIEAIAEASDRFGFRARKPAENLPEIVY